MSYCICGANLRYMSTFALEAHIYVDLWMEVEELLLLPLNIQEPLLLPLKINMNRRKPS